MIKEKFTDILLSNVENLDLSYNELQSFSARFDEKLGYEIERVETLLVEKAKTVLPHANEISLGKSLFEGSETWIGLNPDQLQTTYSELFEALNYINPAEGEVFCDLGAGYGRLGVLIALFFENIHFCGIEIVKERVLEGNRVYKNHSFEKISLEVGVLGKMKIPFAHYYFIYDFSSVIEIKNVLEQISENIKKGPVTIIARGRGVRSIIDHKHHWLSVVYQSRINSFVIYSSVPK